MKCHFILYVGDQQESTNFYARVLELDPILDVPGMTEFELAPDTLLGLMPLSGVRKLLGAGLPEPIAGDAVTKAELYLCVEDAALYHERALAEGARELSAFRMRDWGHRVAYSLDPDGHVLAFAEEEGDGA